MASTTLPKNSKDQYAKELAELKTDSALERAVEDFETIKSSRTRPEFQMKMNSLHYRGDIYSRFNPITNRIEDPGPKKGEVRIDLPLVKTYVDSIVGEMTREDPEWDVLPSGYEARDSIEANWSNMLLDDVWEDQDMHTKAAQWVREGLIKMTGVLEVQFNRGKVELNVVRSEDFYINTFTENVEDAPVRFKVFSQDIGLIRNNPLYAKTKKNWWYRLKPDAEVTDSDELREVFTRTHGQDTQPDARSSVGKVLLAEGTYRFFDGSSEPKYRLITFPVKQPMLMRNEVGEYGKMPWYFPFRPVTNPGEWYGESKVTPVSNLVQAIAAILGKTIRHHQIFTDGAYVADRGAKILTTQGEAGKIFYKTPGLQFTDLKVPQLPDTVFQQIDILSNYIQDSMGVHDVSLGRTPRGLESAKAVESLVYGDKQAKVEISKNYRRALQRAGKYVLLLIAKNVSRKKLLERYNRNGELERFYYGGQGKTQLPADNNDTGQLKVRPDANVQVVIGSGLGNTPEAIYDKAERMFSMGVIGRVQLAKAAKLQGNLRELVEEGFREAQAAVEAQREKPEPADLRNFVNTRLSDLSPKERAQYLIEKLDIRPEDRLSEIPSSLSFKQALSGSTVVDDLKRASQTGQIQGQTDLEKQMSEAALQKMGLINEGGTLGGQTATQSAL